MKKRNSSFELLRIICIFIIILFHYSDHGVVNPFDVSLGNNLNLVFLQFFRIGGGIANAIFVIISGYFLVESKFSLKKVLNLYSVVLFYSVLLGLLSVAFSFNTFSMSFLLHIFFPVSSNLYWFFTCYLFLYFMFPYLNMIVSKCSFKKMIYLLGFGFLIFVLFPSFFKCYTFENNFLIFIFYYFVGAFFKKYGDNFRVIKNNYFLSFVCFIVFILTLVFCIFLAKLGYGFVFLHLVWPFNRIISFVFAIMLFLIFENLNFESSIINYLSKFVFGIYLIHMNSYFWPFFWRILFNNSLIINSNSFLIYCLLDCFLVFLICLIIYVLRKKIFTKIFNL